MARPLELYLDIETTWTRELTVVGFDSSETGLIQLVGKDITRARLKKALPKAARIFTFNGHSFDLSVIHAQLGLNLRDRFESIDLRWSCKGAGLAGGQKAIEARLKFPRRDDGCNGLMATRLWERHQAGDGAALKRLLSYNVEDLRGMQHIKRHLSRKGVPL